jgi:hypothetical protein
MGWFSSTWGDQSRARDRQRRADERDHRRRQRDAKARRRKQWVEHPVRTAWRSR